MFDRRGDRSWRDGDPTKGSTVLGVHLAPGVATSSGAVSPLLGPESEDALMVQPPALLLQQKVALKTARRVAVARGASFASRCMRLENSQRAKWGPR